MHCMDKEARKLETGQADVSLEEQLLIEYLTELLKRPLKNTTKIQTTKMQKCWEQPSKTRKIIKRVS